MKPERMKPVLKKQPEATPLPGEEAPVKQPSRLRRVIWRMVLGLLLIAALVFAYLFLLLGEPEEDAKYAPQTQEASITLPMSAVETPGEADVQSLADTFGQPVLSLYGGLTMQKARIYDTAFEGGYARRVTLTYAFDDGETLTVESVRPIAAAALWKEEGYRLDGETLYYIGGMDAALMANDRQICVFGQTDSAAYAVRCPVQRREELETLLKQTALISAEE